VDTTINRNTVIGTIIAMETLLRFLLPEVRPEEGCKKTS
jgi:hypothetical protein